MKNNKLKVNLITNIPKRIELPNWRLSIQYKYDEIEIKLENFEFGFGSHEVFDQISSSKQNYGTSLIVRNPNGKSEVLNKAEEIVEAFINDYDYKIDIIDRKIKNLLKDKEELQKIKPLKGEILNKMPGILEKKLNTLINER